MTNFEKILYGTNNTAEQGQSSNATDPMLPMPEDVIAFFTAA